MKLFAKSRAKAQLRRDRLDAGVEAVLENFWLCGQYYPVKKRGVFYFYKGDYVDYRQGDLLTLSQTKYGYPVYMVLGWSRNGGGDYAGFDDGRKYSLEFIRFSGKPLKPTAEMMRR